MKSLPEGSGEDLFIFMLKQSLSVLLCCTLIGSAANADAFRSRSALQPSPAAVFTHQALVQRLIFPLTVRPAISAGRLFRRWLRPERIPSWAKWAVAASALVAILALAYGFGAHHAGHAVVQATTAMPHAPPPIHLPDSHLQFLKVPIRGHALVHWKSWFDTSTINPSSATEILKVHVTRGHGGYREIAKELAQRLHDAHLPTSDLSRNIASKLQDFNQHDLEYFGKDIYIPITDTARLNALTAPVTSAVQGTAGIGVSLQQGVQAGSSAASSIAVGTLIVVAVLSGLTFISVLGYMGRQALAGHSQALSRWPKYLLYIPAGVFALAAIVQIGSMLKQSIVSQPPESGAVSEKPVPETPIKSSAPEKPQKQPVRPKLKQRRTRRRQPPGQKKPPVSLGEPTPTAPSVPATVSPSAPLEPPAEPGAPGELLTLLDNSERQDADLAKSAKEAEADNPGNATPVFSVGVSGSFERHPDFGAVGVTIGGFNVPLPHYGNPLDKYKEETDSLNAQRRDAEEDLHRQELWTKRAEAVLQYIDARRKLAVWETFRRAEFEAQTAAARADVQEKLYALLELLGISADSRIERELPEELLADLSKKMNDHLGHVSELDLIDADQARLRILSLSDVRWYHRSLGFKSLNLSTMLNLRHLFPFTPWSLLSGSLSMQSYGKLDRKKESGIVHTDLATVAALRPGLQEDIAADLKLLQAPLMSTPEKADIKSALDQAGERQFRTAARLRLLLRGVSPAEIPAPGTKSGPEIEELAKEKAVEFVNPLQDRAERLEAFAAPVVEPIPSPIAVTGVPPAAGYAFSDTRFNPYAPEIKSRGLTLGTGLTLTLPQTDPNAAPTNVMLSGSQAGHHTTLGTIVIGPNILPRLVIKGVKAVTRRRIKKPKSTVFAGWTGTADPAFVVTGSMPWFPDAGGSFTLSFDPSTRLAAKDQDAATLAADTQVRDKEKLTEHVRADAATHLEIPHADDGAILRMADEVADGPSKPAKHHPWYKPHLPTFNVSSGYAAARSGAYGLTGSLFAPHNVYLHPRKIKKAKDKYLAAKKASDDKRLAVKKTEAFYRIKGWIVVVQARAEAYRVAERAGIQALIDARAAYIRAVVELKSALATLPESEQQTLGLKWEDVTLPSLEGRVPDSVHQEAEQMAEIMRQAAHAGLSGPFEQTMLIADNPQAVADLVGSRQPTGIEKEQKSQEMLSLFRHQIKILAEMALLRETAAQGQDVVDQYYSSGAQLEMADWLIRKMTLGLPLEGLMETTLEPLPNRALEGPHRLRFSA